MSPDGGADFHTPVGGPAGHRRLVRKAFSYLEPAAIEVADALREALPKQDAAWTFQLFALVTNARSVVEMCGVMALAYPERASELLAVLGMTNLDATDAFAQHRSKWFADTN